MQHRARNSTKLLQRSTTMYETRLLWREWETVASDGSTSPATAKDVLGEDSQGPGPIFYSASVLSQTVANSELFNILILPWFSTMY